MESVKNTQEGDILDIYHIYELSPTSIIEAIQPLEESVAYSENSFINMRND